MNNNLLKINGQYVKFYVTTNSQLPEILKNTGAFSVLHKENGNELWLANEFIASGYGFTSYDLLEMGTYAASYFEPMSSYFTYAYSYSLGYSGDLYTDIINRFVTSSGDVSNTKTVIKGFDGTEYTVLIKDLYKFSPYQYKESEELHYNGFCYYTDMTGKERNYAESKDGIISVPYGSVINQIGMEYDIQLNDRAGIEASYFDVNIDKVSGGVHSFDFISAVSTASQTEDAFYSKNGIKHDYVKTVFSYSLEDGAASDIKNPVVDDNYTYMLKNSYVRLYGTRKDINDNDIEDIDKYLKQYYMASEYDAYGKKISYVYSTETELTPKTVHYEDIKVSPSLFIIYYDKSQDILTNFNKMFTTDSVFESLENSIAEFACAAGSVVQFAVPACCMIKRAYFINHKGKEVNVTGDIKEYYREDSSGSKDSIFYKLLKNNEYMAFRFFSIKNVSTVYDANIKIELNNINGEDYPHLSSQLFYSSVDDSSSSIDVSKYDKVQNQDYNTLYWMSSKDLYKAFSIYSGKIKGVVLGDALIKVNDKEYLVKSNAYPYSFSYFIDDDITSLSGFAADSAYCESFSSIDEFDIYTGEAVKMDSMFSGCSYLGSIDLSNIDTVNVETMKEMFKGCSSLGSLDLSDFDTENVKDMSGMLNGCSYLSSIIFGDNFDTHNVIDFSKFLYGCSSLGSIDISRFDLSGMQYASSMFLGCRSAEEIKLPSISDSKIITLDHLCDDCVSLKSINIEDIECNPRTINSCFCNCQSLTSLDLSSIDLYGCNDMGNAFYNCKNIMSFISPKNISVTFSIDAFASKIPHSQLLDVLDNLADVSASGYSMIANIGADALSMLSDDEKSIAEEKGWKLN